MPDGTSCEHGIYARSDADVTVDLRIMATSDLHMQLLPYDYLAGRPCTDRSLTQLAGLIGAIRQEHPNTLLFDNGDLLQGNPMGDYLAEAPQATAQIHPAIALLNALRYDAIALGNHDFNYGLGFLRRTLRHANFPGLAANMRLRSGPQFGDYVILPREVTTRCGQTLQIRVGVIGLLPPQTSHWDRDLRQHVECHDIVETARHLIPRMQAQGAQIIIALAHCGIGPLDHRPGMEHAATALAAIDGIDAVIAGHTHNVFPGPHVPATPGVDPIRGTLAGKPAVMPGYGGSHLGVIDLRLNRDHAGAWRLADFGAKAVPVSGTTTSSPDLSAPALAAHRHTLRHYRRRVGHSQTPLNSYFTALGVDAGLRLVNMAQRWHVRQQLAKTPWRDLPVLAAAAPFRSGGRAGANAFTDVAPGPLTLRALADIYVFPNHACALLATGAQLADWLERAAGAYCQITDRSDGQPLMNPDFPGYNFDVIEGLTWQIDLTRPALYDPWGEPAQHGPGRIRDLRLQGNPVRPDDRFILATSSYRLATCGLYAPLATQMRPLISEGPMVRQVLRQYVRRRRRIALDPGLGLRLLAPPQSKVSYPTGPAAARHLDLLPAQYRASIAGHDDSGHLQLSLRF
ncbi:bifunctional 2',3'-cyclic-nucleotide 2'-phosphodiesterase/3'-nucleotidase [Paracoccus homiensis]|uniref:2',3'-cyclic-nucleotide 2'-phosphodiesterase / 3'-nucleotidase n=1 Tax=Paracoccus homiensis TaxID=364199 RepID=A0A1I0F1G4_9RHOB|nr:bifunctional 2',3'-cyclic-nucleotide 2'-phosphodiesterase/3'-nucleotidase [Paracoccus homiensis]SET51628.1 2',3'-cyclic-nucleotide 2'-phosphodiesterase / 3'-nucleotidase [Paracoccus homiensis]